jgi:hypothetical protein
MPKGLEAPGKVCPWPPVPINGLTILAKFVVCFCAEANKMGKQKKYRMIFFMGIYFFDSLL